jgi:hypothetical protein
MAEKLEFDLLVQKDELNNAINKASQGASKLSDTFKIAAGAFAGGLALNAFNRITGAVGDLIDVLGDSISAASESDQAFKRLELSLAQTGQLTSKLTNDFKSFAEQIQNTTAIEDDAVISSAALLQTIGKLPADALIPATQAAIDLSAALGIDLESAATLVGKAANGNITAFQRQGIEIKKGINDAETFANTLDTLSRFQGAAEAQSKTFNGALSQLRNTYGEILETSGKVITNSGALAGALRGIKSVLDGVNSAGPIINESDIRNASIVVIEVFKVITDAANGLFRIFTAVFNSFSFAIFKASEVVTEALLAPLKVLDEAARALGLDNLFTAPIQQLQSAVTTFSSQAQTDLSQVVDAFDLSKSNSFDNTVDGLNKIKQSIIQTSAEAEAAAPKLQNALNPSGSTQQDEETILRQAELNASLIDLQNQFNLQRNELDLQDQLIRQDAFLSRTQSDLEQISSFEQSKIELELQAQLQRNALTKRGDELALANRKAVAEADLKSARETAKLKAAIQSQQLADQASFFSSAKSLANSENKSLAAIGKAAAIAEIAIRTPQAVASSFAFGTRVGGPPLGFAFGAIAATAMATQAAQVAGLKGFADGGIVGATSGGDNRLATVRDGEMILNAEQQKALFDDINNGGNRGDIIIQVDGREIARAVRNQVRSGFQLA